MEVSEKIKTIAGCLFHAGLLRPSDEYPVADEWKGLFGTLRYYLTAAKISCQFFPVAGYWPNLRNPRTFNEKIQWLKLQYRDNLVTTCADKYRVREYVRSTIGEEHLIPLLGTYGRAEDIDFESLPEQFVLKTNHGSGQNIVCRDKRVLDREDTRRKLSEWMRPESNHYWYSYEWGYKNIEPKIVCEEYIEQENGELPDYKFFCFNGNVRLAYVCSDRLSGSLKVDYCDPEWNRLPFWRGYPNAETFPPPPDHLAEMIRLAEKMSVPFPFVRVDLYEVGDKILFGEMTFYPGNGTDPFNPGEWDATFGDMISLPKRLPVPFS